jgi:hypothetical protein
VVLSMQLLKNISHIQVLVVYVFFQPFP